MKCPGQDTQYWGAEAIYDVSCPKCNSTVEFYKDDTQRKCPSCGHRFVNPKMDFGCASYCRFAEQCVGTLPEDFVIPGDNLLKDKVAVEMKRYFHSDFQRIGRAMRLARYAEAIAKAEGAATAPAICAAYLLEVEHSSDRNTAEQLLVKAGAPPSLVHKVLALLDQLAKTTSTESTEMHILLDARHIMEMEERYKKGKISAETFRQSADTLRTGEGVNLAEKLISDYLAESTRH